MRHKDLCKDFQRTNWYIWKRVRQLPTSKVCWKCAYKTMKRSRESKKNAKNKLMTWIRKYIREYTGNNNWVPRLRVRNKIWENSNKRDPRYIYFNLVKKYPEFNFPPRFKCTKASGWQESVLVRIASQEGQHDCPTETRHAGSCGHIR